MNIKRLTPLFIATLIVVSLSLSAVAYSETDEKYKYLSIEGSGFTIEIEATSQTWPGENTSITVNVKATQANIHVRYIQVDIYSLKENGTKTLLNSTVSFKEAHIILGESSAISYVMLIPEDTLPGCLYGEVTYSLSIEGVEDAPEKFRAFTATYVQNKPYEDLRQAYEALNDFCNDLQNNYTSLEANYTALQEKYEQLAGNEVAQSSATGLMYLFLITTGIFIVTTILLLAKRPKTTAPW